MSQLYKILFEVKVLHEYYLTDPDNTSVFQDQKQTDRLNWLDKRYKSDQPAGSDDLQFMLPPSMLRPFRNQDLRILNSLSGFQVVVRAKEVVQADGSIAYSPAVPLAGGFNMVILMQQAAGGQFGSLTNGRLERPVQALYYFSNADLGAPKTAPVLSRPISAQITSGFPYEQGELSSNGPATELCYYLPDTSVGADPGSMLQNFEVVPGTGFINENDRLIVGREFEYTFEPADNVTAAHFTLTDQAGNVVRTYTTGGSKVLDSVALNFDDAANAALTPLVTLPRAGASDAILYTLQVTGNDGYTKTVPLIFYDVPADLLSTWGVVQVQVSVGNSSYSLLDGAGNLNNPLLPAPDQSDSPYPIFEIRCKSRYTFWRYYSDNSSKILSPPTGAIAAFLQESGGVLTSLSPIPGTYLPYFFSQDPGAASPSYTYLLNPAPDTVIEVDGSRLFSNIWVPESGIFPVTAAPP